MEAFLAWEQHLDAAGFQLLVDNIWEAMMQESPDPELAKKRGAMFATYHQLHRRIVLTLGMDEPETEAFLDEGLSSFCPPNSRFYGESL